MFDDKTRAMLGDHEAAERLTESGEFAPCQCCGKIPNTRVRGWDNKITLSVVCFNCGECKSLQLELLDSEFCKLEDGLKKVLRLWNTRAPILTAEQIAAVERMEANHDE